MESFTSGTLAGAGSFHCEACGFTIALHELDSLPTCPNCEGGQFKRASLFEGNTISSPIGTHRVRHPDWLDDTRAQLDPELDYLAYEADEGVKVLALPSGWTRVGRSLAAQIRFDDPTVSRRHALVHREEGPVRLLDDRSLNGVIVNGERVEWHELADGDEVVIGRFRLYFIGPDHSASIKGGQADQETQAH